MKKVTIWLLTLCMLLGLTGCGRSQEIREVILEGGESHQETEDPYTPGGTDVQEPVEEAEPTAGALLEEDLADPLEEAPTESDQVEEDGEEEGTETADFSLGTNDGSVYENAYLGIGCALDSEWTFSTDEEILEMNNLPQDAGAEELAQLLESDAVQEMYAFRDDGFTTLNIVVSKLLPLEVAAYEIDPDGVFTDSYDSVVEELSAGLEETGCSQISVSAFQETTIAGRDGKALSVSAYYEDTYPVYETIAMFVEGEYLVLATGCTWFVDESAALLDAFYELG